MNVHVLCGSNAYQKDATLTRLVKQFRDEGQGDILHLDYSSQLNLDALFERIKTVDMFSARQCLVVRDALQFIPDAESCQLLLECVPPENVLIFVESGAVDQRTVVVKYLKKQTDFVVCAELAPFEISAWLKEEAKAKQLSLSAGAQEALLAASGTNQLMLSGALDKLALLGQPITPDLVELHIPVTALGTTFQLIEEAFLGNTKKAIALYRSVRKEGTAPEECIGLITWQLFVLLQIVAAKKDPAVAASINPYVKQKGEKLLSRKNITYRTLVQSVDSLAEIDILSKTVTYPTDLALETYFLALAS
jgi:DNA polymerase III delta subunit